MLTTGRTSVSGIPAAASPRLSIRHLKIAAVVAGVLGALLSLAVPALPVTQQTALIEWPEPGGLQQVNAPLTTYQPQDLSIGVPCATAAALDRRIAGPATLIATTPASEKAATRGMSMQIDNGLVTLVSRGLEVDRSPLPAGDCAITVTSNSDATTITVGDETTSTTDDLRPQVVGVYTDLVEGLEPVRDLSVRIIPDTRFQTSPSALKVVASVIAVAAVAVCIGLLVLVDRRGRRSKPRRSVRRWIEPTKQDITIFLVLVAWVLIGGLTSDDGYIRTMLESRDDMGYVGNYYRWFNVPEAPFGWPYELYAQWIRVSPSPVWMRIPAALIGLSCWLVLSRELLPRIGAAVRRSQAATWAAAGVFLAFWMPYDNGLRLEPVVALGSLLTLTLVERAIATRRLAPLALSLLVAAFTVASAPTGFITVAPFLVGAGPLLLLLRSHARTIGWAPILAPLIAVGLLVLVVVFADQTIAAVVEATRIRTEVGPSLAWYEEFNRYEKLFRQSPDGAVARRFPVILLILCIITCVAVLLRRNGIPGAGLGPSRRLIGTALVSIALLALTPTKWTHHFGSFAPIGAALAALTALATSRAVLRSARNRWCFVAALLGVAAFSFAGPNAPWYVSEFGVPWFDERPAVAGIEISAVLVVAAAGAALVALVLNVRSGSDPRRLEPKQPEPPPDRTSRRALDVVSAPLALLCGLIVLAEIGVMGAGMYRQRDSYSLGAANVADIVGSDCSLSDRIDVEPDRTAGALRPLPVTSGPAGGPVFDGFVPGRVPPPTTGSADGDPSDQSTAELDTDQSDDRIGPTPQGINTAKIPAWSSYTATGGQIGQLRTGWFELPEGALRDQPLAVTVAGKLGGSITMRAEFGELADGGVRLLDDVAIGGKRPTVNPPAWRDLRDDLSHRRAAAADVVRLVVEDTSFGTDDWIAVSAPRIPVLARLSEVVGSDTPVLMDWPVGFAHPCLRPARIRDGVSELPAYRLVADDFLLEATEVWSSYQGGGPLGWLEVVAEDIDMPAYLRGDLTDDWGRLQLIEPRVPSAVPATVHSGSTSRSGLWSPGPLGKIEGDSAADDVIR